MRTEYIQTCYREEKKNVTGSRDIASVWIEKSDGNAVSFVGFFQIYSEKRGNNAQEYDISNVFYAFQLSKGVFKKKVVVDR